MTLEPIHPGSAYLILVKHAEPDIDPDRAPTRWFLSSEGMASCVGLALALARYDPSRIVTSHLRKAFETGRIVAENLSIPVTPITGLHEHDRDSVGWLATRTEYNDGVRRALEHPDELVFGDETVAAALERFTAALNAELSHDPTETLIAVTHGTVMSAFLAPRLGQASYDIWKQLGMPSYAVLRRPELDVVELVAAL